MAVLKNGERARRIYKGATEYTRVYRNGEILHHRDYGVTFDADNDQLVRDATLTGASNNRRLSFSFWLDPSDDGTARAIFSGATIFNSRLLSIVIYKASSNRIAVKSINAAGDNLFVLTPTDSILAANGWHHVMGCFDLTNTGKWRIYINGVQQSLSVISFANQDMVWAVDHWYVGSDPYAAGAASVHRGGIGELWVDNTLFDLTVAANRRKFVTTDGYPVFLGDSGELPSGTAPLVYITGPASNWINRGTGGAFTSAGGTLVETATDPGF